MTNQHQTATPKSDLILALHQFLSRYEDELTEDAVFSLNNLVNEHDDDFSWEKAIHNANDKIACA